MNHCLFRQNGKQSKNSAKIKTDKETNAMKTYHFKQPHMICLPFILGLVCSGLFAYAQASNSAEDNKLLENFLNSKKYETTITFDAANIKQYWVDKSVASKNGLINISLKPEENGTMSFSSIPLIIQLANVNEALNCKVDVISEQTDLDFAVSNTKAKVISGSTEEETFLTYRIVSGVFHLEDALNDSFLLQFKSKSASEISIKKIILSFSNNYKSLYIASPNLFSFNKNSVQMRPDVSWDDSSVTGKQTVLSSKNNLLVSNKSIKSTIKIRNTGDTPTRIYIGYYLYAKGSIPLHGSNLPFKDDTKVLSVISAEEGSKTIIVDAYPEWDKTCSVAMNAKEDLSDLPNQSLLDGKIVEVKELENEQAEITLDKPLTKALAKGMKIRITGRPGNSITTVTQVLQPGEELDFAESIQKNDNVFQSTSKDLSKYVYYVKPLLFSYSTDPNKENTIQITEYSVSF